MSPYIVKNQEPQKKKKEHTEPIPVVHIPRKPHPNGLFNIMLSYKSSKTGLPYVLDFEPFLTHPQQSNRETVIAFFKRWNYPYPPSIVAENPAIYYHSNGWFTFFLNHNLFVSGSVCGVLEKRSCLKQKMSRKSMADEGVAIKTCLENKRQSVPFYGCLTKQSSQVIERTFRNGNNIHFLLLFEW